MDPQEEARQEEPGETGQSEAGVPRPEGPSATPRLNPLQVLILIVTLLGLFTILTGVLNLMGGLLAILPNVLLLNVIYYVVFGGLLFLSARLLARKKALGVWIFIAAILLSLGFNLATGHGFSYLTALFGVVVT
ncbi:hypothetical protein FDZ74_11380, partial [bacterium]